MTRYHTTAEGNVPFTEEEEAEWDAREATAAESRKALMVESIKAERDRRRFNGGVQVGDHWYLSTAIATSEYNSLALLSAGLPDDTVLRAAWRTMGGATVDMTPALVRQILMNGFARVAGIDDASQAHIAAMLAAEDPASYDYSGNWPLMFGEEPPAEEPPAEEPPPEEGTEP